MNSGAQSVWGLRLLALIVAVVLWFTVSDRERERQIERALQVPVGYAVPSGYTLLDPEERVSVRLRGPSRRINELRPEDVQVLVELEPPGDIDEPVEVSLRLEQYVQLPHGSLQLQSLTPNEIQLWLDREVTRNVAVAARLTGDPAAGVTLRAAILDPPIVTVRGPASHIAEDLQLSTMPIRLDQRTAPFEATVAVVSNDPMVQVVRPRFVTVTVPLEVTTPASGLGETADLEEP